jgi:hypothetical protein
MKIIRACRILCVAAVALSVCGVRMAAAQTVTQRGFIEGQDTLFAHLVPNDQERQVVDAIYREEVFVKPARWLQFAAGLDFRANTHDQVDTRWRLDFSDRTILRPAAAVRRLAATVTTKYLTVDIGKQFIRWGNADILNPTDRFAPRDYLDVIDTDLIPVLGGRAALHFGPETIEAVVVPRFTPSRLPLFDQRWTVLPPAAAGLTIVDGGSVFPKGSQQGVRWRHAGEHFEASASIYDGFYNLPSLDAQLLSPSSVQLTRFYPSLRTYGADFALPTSWLTLKGEAAYFTSPETVNREYILYVVELERQAGEWMLDGGYIGESVTRSGPPAFRFAPDEGITRSFIGRASYTVDPRRTFTVEGLVRQSGDGAYVKAQFSDALSGHWRVTFTGVGIRGTDTDFVGQFNRNSYGSITLRVSF